MIQRVAIGNVLIHLLPEVSVHGTQMYILHIKKIIKNHFLKTIRFLFHFYFLCCTYWYILDKLLNS